jgi:hypothetical protein
MHTTTIIRLRPVALTLAACVLLAVGAQALAAEVDPGDGSNSISAPAAPPRGPVVAPDRSDLLAMRAEEDLARAARHRPMFALDRIGAAPRVAAAAGSGGANWDATAQCESAGRWDLNTGNGYWGGLQFSPGTWFGNGGGPFDGSGPFPYSAAQQIAVAERVLATQGRQAWPNCFVWS